MDDEVFGIKLKQLSGRDFTPEQRAELHRAIDADGKASVHIEHAVFNDAADIDKLTGKLTGLRKPDGAIGGEDQRWMARHISLVRRSGGPFYDVYIDGVQMPWYTRSEGHPENYQVGIIRGLQTLTLVLAAERITVDTEQVSYVARADTLVER